VPRTAGEGGDNVARAEPDPVILPLSPRHAALRAYCLAPAKGSSRDGYRPAD
jgi:hypothetical protein